MSERITGQDIDAIKGWSCMIVYFATSHTVGENSARQLAQILANTLEAAHNMSAQIELQTRYIADLEAKLEELRNG